MNEQNTAKESNSPSAQDEYTDARVGQTLIYREYFQAPSQPPTHTGSNQDECKSGACSLNWKPARPAA